MSAVRYEWVNELPTLAFEMPAGPFPVVVADPPWLFASNSEASPGKNARAHYECQPTDFIAGMPVGQVTGRNSTLFLWATSPMLPDALAVMAAWGFEYKSQIVWDKERVATGYHVRNQHELVLIGRRGRGPLMAHRATVPSIIRERSRQHSRKPEAFYDMIERGYPGTPKLELFARQDRGDLWTAWGNQTELFNGVAA